MSDIIFDLLREATPNLIDLIQRAVNGDAEASRRLDSVLSDESKLKIQDARAQRLRERHFGDSDG